MNVSRRTLGLALLGCLALGLRVWVVVALRTDHAAPLTYEHGRIAENLLAGRGFSIEFLGREGPTSQQAPFYPALLAAAYWCFGVGTPEAILAVQLLQCVAGTALVLAVVWLGWVLVPDRPSVGWVAGLGAAVFPTHLYMATHCQVALWAALVLTTLLAVVMSPRWRASWGGAALAGCLAGVLLLVEPILSLALPICAVAFWLGEGGRRWSRRFRPAPLVRVAMMSTLAAVVVCPWIVRNWLVHGEFVFVKSTFGYALWQGNNPISWGTDKIPKSSAEQLRLAHDGSLAGMERALWEARHETLYIDDVLLKPSGYGRFVGLSEPERCRRLGRRAVQFIRANPARYAGLCLPVRPDQSQGVEPDLPDGHGDLAGVGSCWAIGLLRPLAEALAHLRGICRGDPVPHVGDYLGPIPHPAGAVLVRLGGLGSGAAVGPSRFPTPDQGLPSR